MLFPRCNLTRYVTAVPVNLSEFDKLADDDENLVFCDTPGNPVFYAESDVVKTLGLVNAVKLCKDIRLQFVLSYKGMGDWGYGLKEAAHQLVSIFPYIREYLSSLSYAFTKFPEGKEYIYPVYDLIEHLTDEEKQDKAFVSILDDMMEKGERGKLKFIRPLTGDPVECLIDLYDTPPITHPEECFYFSLQRSSITIIGKQLSKHRFNIITALKRKDYLLLSYKLKELRFLLNVVDFLNLNGDLRINDEIIQSKVLYRELLDEDKKEREQFVIKGGKNDSEELYPESATTFF